MSKRIYPLLIIGLAIALIILGWSQGEADEVFTKAARICLECMGLGQ